MTGTATPEKREPNRIVVEASDRAPRKRTRRIRKNLHQPCPDQLALFDPENPS